MIGTREVWICNFLPRIGAGDCGTVNYYRHTERGRERDREGEREGGGEIVFSVLNVLFELCLRPSRKKTNSVKIVN